MSEPLIIVGAGGHAAVVADALLAAGETVLGFTDPIAALHGTLQCGLPVLGDDATVLAMHSPRNVRLVNGLGGVCGTAMRQRVQQHLQARGWRFAAVRHPSAIVSRFADLGDATQLLAAGVVQAGARIGNGCIVNTAAVVEHDCRLGSQVHVAPRALLCGGVEVGSGSHIGAGAVLRQGVRLGPETVVGAGAVVLRDSPGGQTLVGTPARPRGSTS
jgi:sugar O-acyltransferase (sialic acid O-acetyltransferase NeuD family)